MPLKSSVSPSTTLGVPWINSLAPAGGVTPSSSAARQPTAAAASAGGGCGQRVGGCCCGVPRWLPAILAAAHTTRGALRSGPALRVGCTVVGWNVLSMLLLSVLPNALLIDCTAPLELSEL